MPSAGLLDFFCYPERHTGLAHHTDVVSGLGNPRGHMVGWGAKQFANLLTGVSVLVYHNRNRKDAGIGTQLKLHPGPARPYRKNSWSGCCLIFGSVPSVSA